MALNGIVAGGFANGFLNGFQTMGQELARQGLMARYEREDARAERKAQLDEEIARQDAARQERESNSLIGYRDTQTEEARAKLPFAAQMAQEGVRGLELGNAGAAIKNQYLGPAAEADIAGTRASTSATQATANLTGIKARSQEASDQAAIAESQAQTNKLTQDTANTAADREQQQRAQRVAGVYEVLKADPSRFKEVVTPEVLADATQLSGIPITAFGTGDVSRAVKTLAGFTQGQVDKRSPEFTQALGTVFNGKVNRNLNEPVSLLPGQGGELHPVSPDTPGAINGRIVKKEVAGVYDVPDYVIRKMAQQYQQQGLSPEQAERQARLRLGVNLNVTVKGEDGRELTYLAPLTRDGSARMDDEVYFPGPEDLAENAGVAEALNLSFEKNPDLYQAVFETAASKAKGKDGDQALKMEIEARQENRAARGEARQVENDRQGRRDKSYQEATQLIDKQYGTLDPMTGLMAFQGDSAQRAADEKIEVAKVLKSNPELSGAEAVEVARQNRAKRAGTSAPGAAAQGSDRVRSFIDQHL